MSNVYIYIVGQPDPQAGTLAAIRKLGYKAGILADSHLHLEHSERYDRVEMVNFAQLDEEIERLEAADLSIAGLVCTYENYVVSKAKLAEHFNVPGISVESARLSTDKALMREAFIASDPSISPRFTTIQTVDDGLAFANEHGYPLIIKPTNLVKSLLVLRSDNENELIENINYAQATISALYEKYHIYGRSAHLIIEEFITGKQCSVAAFIDANGTSHFCDGIVALTNAQDIHVDDNYLYRRALPVAIEPELEQEMFRVAEAGIRALKMTSVPAHVELMYGPQGVKIIEIGARIGGYRPRMYGYSYGVDLAQQEVALSTGNKPQLKGQFANYCAVYELFPNKEGAFTEVRGEVDKAALAYYRERLKPGDITGPAKNGYKASTIAIVSDPDESRFHELCRQVETLTVEVQ